MNSDLADDLELIRAAGLDTGRYQTWKPADGVPIRSTVGEPKFWGQREPLVFVRALAPYGVFGRQLPPDEARRRYLDRLDRHADEIVVTLAAVARSHPGRRLVTLCFENVQTGEVCHRRWFAEWMAERHGVEVPERPEPVDQPQLPL